MQIISKDIFHSVLRKTCAPAIFLCCCFTFSGCSSFIDKCANKTYLKPPYSATKEAETFHNKLRVVDLHADTFLWKRGLLKQATRGHIDLARLQQGNVAIQVFAAVTYFPLLNIKPPHKEDYDAIGPLMWMQGWPQEIRKSLMMRAQMQALKLKNEIRLPNGQLRLILSKKDLDEVLSARDRGEKVIGVILALEGAHVLEGDRKNITDLFYSGYRMLGLTHFNDNEMAGAAQGKKKHGLTDEGMKLVPEAQEMGIIIDLAHASEETIDDVLQVTQKPVLASHTGVKGTCDNVRNLGPAQVRGIVDTGGIVGIGLFKKATCGKTVAAAADAMRYVLDLTGPEGVALGSDFDGFVGTAVDASGLVLLTEELCKNSHNEVKCIEEQCGRLECQGQFTKDEIRGAMGENAIKMLRSTLP